MQPSFSANCLASLMILPKLLFCDKVIGKRIHTGAGTAGLCLLQSGNRTDFREAFARMAVNFSSLSSCATVCLRREGRLQPRPGPAGRDTKPVGSPTGIQHGRDKQMVECADVDVQRIGSSGDFGCLLRVACHDGTVPAGKQEIRAVIDGDKIGDAVNQRIFPADWQDRWKAK